MSEDFSNNPIEKLEQLSQSSKKNTPQSKLKVFQPLLFAFVMVLGMQVGYKMYEGLNRGAKVSVSQNAPSLVEDVLRYIDTKYVDTTNQNQMVQGIIENALSQLDPHSRYIPPQELQSTNENLEGNFDGIGIEFSLVDDTITVVGTIAGGPSAKVGILPGDKIVMVEDSLIAGIDLKNGDVTTLLKGKRGTRVNIKVARNGVSQLLPFSIVRDVIPIYSLEAGYMLTPKIAYIKLDRFSATTYAEFKERMEQLEKKGMQQLILDLRSNGGGFLTEATQIADEFLAGKKVMVFTEGSSYERQEYITRRKGDYENTDIVVLIDQNSASAAEIMAGAIQDWDRGTIIGRRSFGKGLVQEQYDLKNGGAMRLTVARYYTPSGRCIQKSYNKKDDYSGELVDRYYNGELFSADSIKVTDTIEYTTPSGRILYGGGGITPDIFVPLDTTDTEDFYIEARSFIPEFAYSFFSKNQKYFLQFKNFEQFKQEYSLSQKTFNDYLAFVEKKEVKIDKNLLQSKKPAMEQLFKAYLARQIWQGDGFYGMINDDDIMIKTAINQLKKGNELPKMLGQVVIEE